jgi:hypothetical protein
VAHNTGDKIKAIVTTKTLLEYPRDMSYSWMYRVRKLSITPGAYDSYALNTPSISDFKIRAFAFKPLPNRDSPIRGDVDIGTC